MRTDRKKKLLLPLAASLLMLLMILEGSPVLQGSGFGAVTAQAAQSNLYSVHVDSGYLALRTRKPMTTAMRSESFTQVIRSR